MLFGLCCPFTSYLLRLLPSRGKDQERDLRVSAMKRPALSLLNLIAIHNKGLVVTTDNIYTVVLSMIILLGSPGYLRSVFTALSTMPTFCISTTAIKRGTTTATLFLASLCLSSKRSSKRSSTDPQKNITISQKNHQTSPKIIKNSQNAMQT